MKALLPTPDQPGLVVSAEIPEPDPAADEAVVEVAAFSVNRGETFLLREPPSGWRPGKDIAGVVVRAAADGSGPAVGTRVVGHPESGGWAELAAVPTSRLAMLPDSVGLVTGAALPLAGLTALRLIRAAGPLPGVRVLLTGASGGVGHYFTELAAAQGALVTAVCSSAQRGDRLRELGAAGVVTAIGDAEPGFGVAIESVGGTTTRQAWHALDRRALLIWCGQASGQVPALDFFDWQAPADITIRKFHYMDSDLTVADDLATLARLVAGRRLHPEIGVVADWEATGQAIEQLLGRSVRGNAVLTVGGRIDSFAPEAVRRRDPTATPPHQLPARRYSPRP